MNGNYKVIIISLFSLLLTFNSVAFGDTDPELKELEISAENGNISAQKELSQHYYLRHEFPKAIEWITRSAELGDAESQATLGLIYYSGSYNVESNFVKAKKWVGKACEQKLENSCEAYNNMTLDKPCRLVDMQVWICN